MSMRSIALMIGVIVVGLVAMGCGDDESSGADTAPTEKAEFAREANAICEASKKQIRTETAAFIAEGGAGKSADAQSTEFVNTVLIPTFQDQVDEIRALSPPSGEEYRVNAVLAAMQETLDESKNHPLTLVHSANPFAKANRLSNSYGLKACDQG